MKWVILLGDYFRKFYGEQPSFGKDDDEMIENQIDIEEIKRMGMF